MIHGDVNEDQYAPHTAGSPQRVFLPASRSLCALPARLLAAFDFDFFFFFGSGPPSPLPPSPPPCMSSLSASSSRGEESRRSCRSVVCAEPPAPPVAPPQEASEPARSWPVSGTVCHLAVGHPLFPSQQRSGRLLSRREAGRFRESGGGGASCGGAEPPVVFRLFRLR